MLKNLNTIRWLKSVEFITWHERVNLIPLVIMNKRLNFPQRISSILESIGFGGIGIGITSLQLP